MTDRIADLIARASTGPVETTVRKLLAVWGFRNRTHDNVLLIERDLAASGLRCTPDLNAGSLTDAVHVGAQPVSSPNASGSGTPVPAPPVLPPTLMVRDVQSAGHGVTSVKPDQDLVEVRKLMMELRYSQLAVMSGDSDLQGAVTWRGIARAYRARPTGLATVKDAMFSPVPEVRADAELLGQIGAILYEGFALVRNADHRICGIVTTADLAVKFQDLTTPYFQIRELERRLRRCIDAVFDGVALRTATGANKLQSAGDMTFQQYLNLLDDEARWSQMGWGQPDRTLFLNYLEEVREIRNKVMHFTQELRPTEKQTLVHCLNFMKELDLHP